MRTFIHVHVATPNRGRWRICAMLVNENLGQDTQLPKRNVTRYAFALPVGVCYPRIRPATQLQIQQPIQIQIHLQVAPAKRVSGGIRHEATSHNLNIH